MPLAPLETRGVEHKCTRPYSHWQNGKVERMNRTLAQEWQYGRAWDSEAGRASALPAFIDRYNWDRPHSACGGLPPMSRIVGVNNLLAHNTLAFSAHLGSKLRGGLHDSTLWYTTAFPLITPGFLETARSFTPH